MAYKPIGRELMPIKRANFIEELALAANENNDEEIGFLLASHYHGNDKSISKFHTEGREILYMPSILFGTKITFIFRD